MTQPTEELWETCKDHQEVPDSASSILQCWTSSLLKRYNLIIKIVIFSMQYIVSMCKPYIASSN